MFSKDFQSQITIIPQVRFGYEMVDSQWGAELAIIISYPTNASGIIVFFKNAYKISRILCDLYWFVKTMTRTVTPVTRTSYTMMAKTIRALELHYLSNDSVFNKSYNS